MPVTLAATLARACKSTGTRGNSRPEKGLFGSVASPQVVVHRFMKTLLELRDRFAIEPDDVANARQVADEAAVFFAAVLDAGRIALAGHGVLASHNASRLA